MAETTEKQRDFFNAKKARVLQKYLDKIEVRYPSDSQGRVTGPMLRDNGVQSLAMYALTQEIALPSDQQEASKAIDGLDSPQDWLRRLPAAQQKRIQEDIAGTIAQWGKELSNDNLRMVWESLPARKQQELRFNYPSSMKFFVTPVLAGESLNKDLPKRVVTVKERPSISQRAADARFSNKDAAVRAGRKSRNPELDRQYRAQVVAPAVATDEQGLKLQKAWFKDPSGLDMEGIDTPAAGMERQRKPRQRKAAKTPRVRKAQAPSVRKTR